VKFAMPGPVREPSPSPTSSTATAARTPPAQARPAVTVTNVRKAFRIPQERHTSFKARATELFGPEAYETLRALDGVSFEVARGEFLGVVGRNGSGKSTLLKCIAGIYDTDSGAVTVTGRLSPFLEMGVGFKSELSARENVLLNGALLGLTRAELRERLDDIIAFAELQDFADLKLKNFSSGMRVRLAFSLAIQVDADVLLLDEVLAVGDEAFQEKCFEQFDLFKQEGRTVLFVSHSMPSVERFCDRAVLLDSGRVAAIGDAAAVAADYHELNARAREREAAEADQRRAAHGVGTVRRSAFSGSLRPATYRPSALGDDLRRFVRVTLVLASAEFRLHYQGSVLGYLWSVMQPLMLFGVLFAVFSTVVGLGAIDGYPLYVLSAVVLWTFFTEATSGGVTSLVASEALLRKMRFPRMAIPLSVSLKALFNLGMNAIVVLAFALISGVRPRLGWLELPMLVVLLAALTTGLTMLLSALYVRYRDTSQIWRVAERVLFFISPIFYPATLYPDAVGELLSRTPLVMILSEMRHAFIDPAAPSAAALAGGAGWLAVPVGICAAVLALGVVMFNRQAPLIAERL
jgi:ABC-type polysaccharide/polyol phosphate transport system ATPase subunit/ABC-type polysaccharide/polyol phosphate export permease